MSTKSVSEEERGQSHILIYNLASFHILLDNCDNAGVMAIE